MSVIYMRHPVHGAKVAISEHEAIQDEMYGWERFTLDEAQQDHDGGALPEDNSMRRRKSRRAAQEE